MKSSGTRSRSVSKEVSRLKRDARQNSYSDLFEARGSYPERHSDDPVFGITDVSHGAPDQLDMNNNNNKHVFAIISI